MIQVFLTNFFLLLAVVFLHSCIATHKYISLVIYKELHAYKTSPCKTHPKYATIDYHQVPEAMLCSDVISGNYITFRVRLNRDLEWWYNSTT